MGSIELIEGVGIALLWLLSSAAVLLVALSLAPVYVRARVDPLHFDEETPWDWDAVPFEVDLSALFGALGFRFERRDGKLQVAWRLFGIARPVRADGGRRGRHPPGELGEQARRWRKANRPVPRRRENTEPAGNARRRRRREISLDELRRLLPELRWLLAQARRRMKLEVRGALVYGFSDPFATAVAHLATAALPHLPRLRLQPDYSQGTLRGHVELSLRMYPWQGVFLLVRACLRPNVRSLWWSRVRNALRARPLRLKSNKTNQTKEVVAS